MFNFHVAIIGGGVIGSAIARELSKYKINVIVFEMGSDVASGVSKANSGVVHSGINSAEFSLKARFCVEGNKMFQHLADELNIPLKWVGKLVIAKNDEEINKLECLKNVEKSGNYKALFERTKHFYNLLNHDIFSLRGGLIFLKENENILKNFNKIRTVLLENGLYFPLSPVSPIFLSYTHSEELLIKCARQINLVFSKFYR